MAGPDLQPVVQAALPRAVTHARCSRGRRKAPSGQPAGTGASPLPLATKRSAMGLGVRARGQNPPS